ncbi:FAD-binding oxidoreductase [Ponticoccus sp. SC2-23]|uniref:NAD(P)/FAD-dependent oxidoreductase n=1 Tax=Alexandriicola marinus TaxID=2081710 RepID=UPI000FD888CF|nr:FAD-binding oxidoreductase [Alexandriicola marinus]MBM1222142.1 FAD-binding oxidoreductase [Ponticoccus sp. SC6-9]MBM1226829.1 FAD-binding oxidoreductase [Ponticoccus sp. SC6-15]MBM1231089.1 FAD-binding oxidoreductase [Ponticoccus sp. SC6-38]MBM1235659.1 FAD-binding oxidoreductase [Ponticoccus sp. SC6-45]MBM1240111.1 FAD-binding oxidoreductase [Ponticoccus sp. SC6-49]MBM1244465.1 FAD-binding oxidoreductase [Ponticoccus sp. SC2-64]MBM1249133.1 FAD-binding oxidoreductase [Ponticoccus sp. SC
MSATSSPRHGSYDIVIIGGAIMGSSVAWWTLRDPDFTGRVLVIEPEPGYERAATSLTNSCIRQQFGTEVNIRASQFGAEFVNNFRNFMEDEAAPDIPVWSFGYLYLAQSEAMAHVLRQNHALQSGLGVATQLLSPAEIAERYPFYDLDGVTLGSHNAVDEGYFDGGTVFDWFRRKSRALGAEWVTARVTDLRRDGRRISAVMLDTGDEVACGAVVNCAGTRGPEIAAMAGLDLPVEPRKRFSFVFEAEDPLPVALPLTIDPSGLHVRSDGPRTYLAGCAPADDAPVQPDDFEMDWDIWEDRVWPTLAARVPAFERIRLRTAWAGHYDYNTLDQNAVLGPHPEITNFHFCNGFSGHGLQHSPAIGRGLSEMLIHGAWRSLDLSDLSVTRIAENRPLIEPAVI